MKANTYRQGADRNPILEFQLTATPETDQGTTTSAHISPVTR